MQTAERDPETAQVMITNPLSTGGLRGPCATHPATEERVDKPMAMAEDGLSC